MRLVKIKKKKKFIVRTRCIRRKNFQLQQIPSQIHSEDSPHTVHSPHEVNILPTINLIIVAHLEKSGRY